jgi:hypothetical protein
LGERAVPGLVQDHVLREFDQVYKPKEKGMQLTIKNCSEELAWRCSSVLMEPDRKRQIGQGQYVRG